METLRTKEDRQLGGMLFWISEHCQEPYDFAVALLNSDFTKDEVAQELRYRGETEDYISELLEGLH